MIKLSKKLDRNQFQEIVRKNDLKLRFLSSKYVR